MTAQLGKRIVDLRRSKIDEKNSDPKTGKYVFLDKVYTERKNASEDKFFTWCRYSPTNNYRDLDEWKLTGHEPVRAVVDPYWPEGVRPNGEGYYIKQDLIFVMRSLAEEVAERMENENRGKVNLKAMKSQFQQQAKQGGSELTDLIDETFKV